MESPRGWGVAARALAMLARPGRTFDRVAEESGDLEGLFRRYVALLAAIPAVCGVIGPLVFGFNVYNVGIHMSALGLILGAVVEYGLTIVAVYLAGLFVELTTPWFGGQRSRDRALRLAAYSATAVWVAGLAEIYPNLGLPLGILAAMWSLYALYVGLSRLMGVPDERRLIAFAAVLVALAVLGWARGAVVAKAAELGGPLSASYAPAK
jgi:hypothetical protein